MKIGIDGYNIAMPAGTGIATYGTELASAVAALGFATLGVFGLGVPMRSTLRETAFFDAFQRPAARRSKIASKTRRMLRSLLPPRPREVPLTMLVDKQALGHGLPTFDHLVTAANLFDDAFSFFRLTGKFTQLRLSDPPDIMHWTYPLPIAVAGIRNIYTLHDLVPLKLPYTTLDNKGLYEGVMSHCVATAARICTVSESSRRDILDRYGVDERKIINTYQTATLADEVSPHDAAANARAIEGIFGLGIRQYFLFYGAIEPKKNVGRLIEAYLGLQTETPLVIVGARAWQSEQELRLLPDGGAGGGAGIFRGPCGQTVIRLDYLARPLLAKLVQTAKAVVFPSLYEGFGLPVLEAMQMGTPVITSTTSSMPEVAGDAGILIDPYDVTAIAQAMRRLDADEALCRRASRRGLEQAASFSRARYRERLAALYADTMQIADA